MLILINVVAFLFTFQNPAYLDKYGFSVNALAEGRYYTIFTSIFLHSSVGHLIANMIALLILGGSIESKGMIKYLLVYFLAGVTGIVPALVPIFGYTPDTVFVGASGAISGLIGLGIFVNPGGFVSFPWIIPIPFIVASAIYIIYTSSLLFDQSGVAYPAHLSGMLAGMVFGMIFGEKRIKRLLLFITVLVLIVILPSIIRSMLG